MDSEKSRLRPPSKPFTFRTTFRNTIYEALKNRPGWKETEGDDWDLHWTEKDWMYEVFDGVHLSAWQRVNHFRNQRELCRKDLLVKNLKRHKRFLQKDQQERDNLDSGSSPATPSNRRDNNSHGSNWNAGDGNNGNNGNSGTNSNSSTPPNTNQYDLADDPSTYTFWPLTYVLPGDYALFVEEFKRNPTSLWIMKPVGRAQGKGIFLFTQLKQIGKWKSDSR